MIELIFALVVMAIALLSAPRLIYTASESGIMSIQQEAINEAATKVNMIMSYPWDESNTDSSFLAPILYTTSGDSNLNEFNSSGRRAGTPLLSSRSFIRTDGQTFNASGGLGFDAGETTGTDIDDMDDFADAAIATSTLEFIESDDNDVDYVEDNSTIQINTVVSYMNDTPTGGTYSDPGADGKLVYSPSFTATAPGGTTNVKKIIVTLTSSSASTSLNTKSIVLKAFTCNIGNYSLERDF
jgi:hypothetical protein